MRRGHKDPNLRRRRRGTGRMRARAPELSDPRWRLPHDGSSLLQDTLIAGYLQVADEEAISTARPLAVEEGIFAGYSGGANVAAALQLLN